MKSWEANDDGVLARAEATRALCEYFNKTDEQNQKDRGFCVQVPPTTDSLKRTKELFAQEGGFLLQSDSNTPTIIPIPADTVIRVYEQDKRDDIVTIVLPTQGKVPQGDRFVARDFYRCSYWPY